MAAVPVTGSLGFFGREAIPSSRAPELWFRPSEVASKGAFLFAAEPRKATLTGTSWTVTLEETYDFPEDVHYLPEIHYFSAGGNLTHVDELWRKIRVPAGGGSIADFPTEPQPGAIIVDAGPPKVTGVVYIDWANVTSDGVLVYAPESSV